MNKYYKIENCVEGDSDYLIDRLVEYNLSQVPAEQEILFEPLDKKICDENGRIIAGCVARMYCWNVAYIDTLWVDKDCRGEGLGSMLLREVETAAREKGCLLVHLDTFDFQAKGFYERYGYELFGRLDECPKGHQRYYFKKVLL